MTDCTRFEALLLDGSAEAMAEAGRHAAGCAPCAESLAIWRDLSDTAASMRTEWQSDLLWPRIERSIAAERPRASRRLWRAAAAAVVFLVLGATMIYALRMHGARAAFDREILRLGALDEVERAEQVHVAAIGQLEKLAEQRIEDSETPLMVSYREKLMLLDEAIAECQSAIERNRQNAHLRKQLLAVYSEKQSTLEDVLREENDEN